MQNATESHEHRALGLSAVGVLVMLIGGFIAHQGWTALTAQSANVPSAYNYSVKQSANTNITYMDSSFFGSAPNPDNHAYVSDLTKDVTANFHYEFSGSEAVDITTTYSIKAEIRANYALKGNTEDSSNVWRQEYLLVKPTSIRVDGTSTAIDKSVTIPYAEYKKIANQFRTTLALPTSSEAVATLSVRTTGTVDGTPFEDVRVSTVAIPLEEQIYQPAIKFDKEDSKQVVAQNEKQGQDRAIKIQLFGGAAVIVAGFVLAVYGLRKRIFKSAYQRELDKIYRYHDGIIVRTSRPIDLAEHRVVPMRTFDDMLNLEEELKTPIIADEISSTLTHFLIAHSNVTYLYKLGDGSNRTNQAIAARTTNQALAAAQHPRVAREVLAPTPAKHGSVAIPQDTSDEWGDIIHELDKKPAAKTIHHKKKIQ